MILITVILESSMRETQSTIAFHIETDCYKLNGKRCTEDSEPKNIYKITTYQKESAGH